MDKIENVERHAFSELQELVDGPHKAYPESVITNIRLVLNMVAEKDEEIYRLTKRIRDLEILIEQRYLP